MVKGLQNKTPFMYHLVVLCKKHTVHIYVVLLCHMCASAPSSWDNVLHYVDHGVTALCSPFEHVTTEGL